MIDKMNDPFTFWGILIASNLAMYLFTIAISFLWSKAKGHKMLKLSSKDAFTSLAILAVNILVAIPGYFLFIQGYIEFSFEGYFVLDFLLLFFVFDLGMYVVHIISHYVWPFNKFHDKHHAHHHFNAISLYVMEPIESILFGVLLTTCTFFMQLNLYSFLAFLFLNWVLGVIGHLNTDSTKQPLIFGNHVFHKTHHQQANSNFGFYTLIWDRLFGTLYKNQK